MIRNEMTIRELKEKVANVTVAVAVVGSVWPIYQIAVLLFSSQLLAVALAFAWYWCTIAALSVDTRRIREEACIRERDRLTLVNLKDQREKKKIQ